MTEADLRQLADRGGGGMIKPKIVVLCGSSRFCDVMAVCAWLIERDELAITMGLHLLPNWYCENLPANHLAEFEGVASSQDELHLRKIDLADEIFVVNKNDYIGESTTREIKYAASQGKKVRWYTHDPIGEMTEQKIKEALERMRDKIEESTHDDRS